MEEKIKEVVSATEKRKLEEERWKLEEDRQRIERERWEYDEAIGQVAEDVAGLTDEMSTNNELIAVATSRRQKLEFELKKIESVERKSLLQDKIKEIEALRVQVTSKQKELRDAVQGLQDREKSYTSKEKDVSAKIRSVGEDEHRASTPKDRHMLEQKRWDLEKERKAAQDMIWKIQTEKQEIDNQRLVWTKRDEKFVEAITKLKAEMIGY